MPPAFHRDCFTWLAYFALAFYAYFLNILEPITPFLKEELNLSYTVSSLHFTAFTAGILLIGFAGHLPIQRVSRWGSLLIGRNPVVTIDASFLMGLIGSLILAIVPADHAYRVTVLRNCYVTPSGDFADVTYCIIQS